MAVPSAAAATPKSDPVESTRTNLTFASLCSAILSATLIASRSNPEPSVGTMIVLYMKASSQLQAAVSRRGRAAAINFDAVLEELRQLNADLLSEFPCFFTR